VVEYQLDLLRADELARFRQLIEHCAILLDHHHARGAARGRLEAERAAAGEEIEAAQSLQPLPEPVEERLAHPIGRRAQARPRRYLDATVAVFVGDDANSACLFGPFVMGRMHRPMVATSWAARLKAGLARTRDVLNTPVSELFVHRRVDEALFHDLESALLQADCGVAATEWLLTELRARAAKERIEDGEALKRALKDALAQLLAPLEKKLDVSA